MYLFLNIKFEAVIFDGYFYENGRVTHLNTYVLFNNRICTCNSVAATDQDSLIDVQRAFFKANAECHKQNNRRRNYIHVALRTLF